MNVKRKLLKKAATKIKKKIGSMNSTDNMSSKGPIDKSINKVKAPDDGMTWEDMIPDINPNEYGYGTDGLYQAPPKVGKVKKIIENVIDIDDPF